MIDPDKCWIYKGYENVTIGSGHEAKSSILSVNRFEEVFLKHLKAGTFEKMQK